MKLHVQNREAYAYTGGKPFETSAPTVVFVHGAVNDHGVFNLLARWCAHHGYGVLAIDLPAHMRSQGPALPSIESMADWLLEGLTTLGIKRAAFVGHSMGSLVALEAAARGAGAAMSSTSPRASHLVMIGTCVPMPVPQALLDLSRSDRAAAIERVVTYSFSTLAPKPSFPGPGVWPRGLSRSLMHMVCDHAQAVHNEPDLFWKDFNACNTYTQGLEAAKRLTQDGTCPTTLILGQHDQMTLARAAAPLAEALKASVHALEAGHFPMSEAPDAVWNALQRGLHAPSRAT